MRARIIPLVVPGHGLGTSARCLPYPKLCHGASPLGPSGWTALRFDCRQLWRSGSRHTTERTQLIAIWVAQVSKVSAAGTNAGRVFDRRTAVCDTRLVPGVGLLRVCHRESD